MYGLINKAIQGLITEKFGHEVWDDIRTRAGLTVEPFLSMEQYPDSITYDLVGAASDVLELPAEQVLNEFGIFWTMFTGAEGYKDLMETSGETFSEFVANLDQLHARVKLLFPHLDPPSFLVTDRQPTSLKVRYFSNREGLSPLVEGLFQGLANRFDISLSVQHEHIVENGTSHDLFSLSWKEASTEQSRPNTKIDACTQGCVAK
ncbi:heme NO-binding protein [bacterium]|nr:heme NO-binding protein [bacterium]